jgi:hypothetical protein
MFARSAPMNKHTLGGLSAERVMVIRAQSKGY